MNVNVYFISIWDIKIFDYKVILICHHRNSHFIDPKNKERQIFLIINKICGINFKASKLYKNEIIPLKSSSSSNVLGVILVSSSEEEMESAVDEDSFLTSSTSWENLPLFDRSSVNVPLSFICPSTNNILNQNAASQKV